MMVVGKVVKMPGAPDALVPLNFSLKGQVQVSPHFNDFSAPP